MITAIGLCGATGRMGLAIKERINHFPELRITETFPKRIKAERDLKNLCANTQIIIDFSTPILLPQLLEHAAQFNNKLIIGTTGFDDEHLNLLNKASKKIAIFYSANMSVGVNLLSNLISYLAHNLDENYDIDIIDTHHRFKKDRPSGTAIMLREAAIGDNIQQSEAANIIIKIPRAKGTINISSIRRGNIIGTHEVLFTSNTEVISVKHQALHRNLFADGALKVAIWMKGQTEPGLYSIKDMLNNRP